MKVKDFIDKLNSICGLKTLYIMGGFGAPLTESMKKRVKNAQEYNRKPERVSKIDAASPDTFGFDCCGLVKSVLWGFSADLTHIYGGAEYKANSVPDTNTLGLLRLCTNISQDFNNIVAGEYVYMDGHCGVYVGDGYVVEATPIWKDGVQRTKLNQRVWTHHGKLPWIDYTEESPTLDNKIPSEWFRYINDMLCNIIFEIGELQAELAEAKETYGDNDLH